MAKLIDEIKYDLDYLRSHTLQPQWFKVLKVFILLGVAYGYGYLFGLTATVLFFAAFFFLSLLVHFTYRAKTNRWTESWLDFVVVQEDGVQKTKPIGKFYYAAVIFNAMLAFIISQILA